jgi:branched-chain amino acid transport system permease protein
MLVLGGMGTISGSIAGALSVTYLLETMRVFSDYRMVIYGLLMFLIIVYMPQGLVGLGNNLINRVRKVSAKSSERKKSSSPEHELAESVKGQV